MNLHHEHRFIKDTGSCASYNTDLIADSAYEENVFLLDAKYKMNIV